MSEEFKAWWAEYLKNQPSLLELTDWQMGMFEEVAWATWQASRRAQTAGQKSAS